MLNNKLKTKIVLLVSVLAFIFTPGNVVYSKEDPVLLSRLTDDRYIPGQLTVVFCDGPVYYKSYNSKRWVKVKEHQSFKHGDSLRTGNHGYAVISWSADNLLLVKPKSSMRFAIQPQKVPQVVVQLYKATLMISARESGLVDIEGKNGTLTVNHGESTIQSHDNHEIIRAVKGQANFRMNGNADKTVIPESYFLEFSKSGKDLPIRMFDPQTEYDSYRRFATWLNKFNDLHERTSLEIPYKVDSVRINDEFLSNMAIDKNGFYIIDSGNRNITHKIHLQFKITPYPGLKDKFALYINKNLAYAIREGENGYHEVVFETPSIPDFFIAIHSIDSLKRSVRIFKARFTVLNRRKKQLIARKFCKDLESAINRKNQMWLRDYTSKDYRDWLGNSYFDMIKCAEDTLRQYRDIRYFIHPYRFESRNGEIHIHANYRITALTRNWGYRFEDKGTDIFTLISENGSWKLKSKVSGLFFQQMRVAADLRLGLVKGRISDERTGAPISGVEVSLRNTRYHTYTNSMGEYAFYNVVPGTYDLLMSKNGYGKLTATKVVVKASGEQF